MSEPVARYRITQRVLEKAGRVGLSRALAPGEKLVELLDYMAHHAAKATGRRGIYPDRRRFGHFVMIIREGKVLDLIPERGDWCRNCLGAGVSARGLEINCNCGR